jgi:hypothetical protein
VSIRVNDITSIRKFVNVNVVGGALEPCAGGALDPCAGGVLEPCAGVVVIIEDPTENDLSLLVFDFSNNGF